MSSTWHAMDPSEVLQKLGARPEGLTEREAEERLAKFGYNELVERRRRTLLQMFLGEFKDVFVLLLLAASVLSAFIGYYESAHLQSTNSSFFLARPSPICEKRPKSPLNWHVREGTHHNGKLA